MIDLAFPQPKDPEDQAWYFFYTDEVVDHVLRSVATPTQATSAFTGTWMTPGDRIANGPLTVIQHGVMQDGAGVAVLLGGGVPGQVYAVRVRFVTISGSVLNRSGIVQITGL